MFLTAGWREPDIDEMSIFSAAHLVGVDATGGLHGDALAEANQRAAEGKAERLTPAPAPLTGDVRAKLDAHRRSRGR